MAGIYTFQRGHPIAKGLYQGYLRAQELMKLLKKQKVTGVCYTDLPSDNKYSWEPIIEISWR